MKRFLPALLYVIAILGIYFLIDVRFFNLDLLKGSRMNLFSFFNESRISDDIVLYNTGKLSEAEIIENVHVLRGAKPKVIGINACGFQNPKRFVEAFAKYPEVIISSCPENGRTHLSRVVQEGNIVTHFEVAPDLFEMKIVGRNEQLESRGNEYEMISYKRENFYKVDLKDAVILNNPNGSIFLVGYLGDHITEEIYNFESCRITPLNPYFSDISTSPDMYDLEIVAHVIATILDDEFITEVPLWGRVLIMLGICLLNVGIIMLIKTRWMVLNIVIYLCIYFLTVLLSGLALLYAFAENIYLNLDRLEIVLFIACAFTVGSAADKKDDTPVERIAVEEKL